MTVIKKWEKKYRYSLQSTYLVPQAAEECADANQYELSK